MGDGYIRYDNGLQICYGTTKFDTVITTQWASMYEATTDTISSFTFPKPFSKAPWVSATSIAKAMFIQTVKTSTSSVAVAYITRPDSVSAVHTYGVDYIAIGTWK